MARNPRGRPAISIDGSSSLTAMIPTPLHNRLCKVSLDAGKSVSSIVRTQLVSVQHAMDIVPILEQFQTERHKACAVAKEALALAEEQARIVRAQQQVIHQLRELLEEARTFLLRKESIH